MKKEIKMLALKYIAGEKLTPEEEATLFYPPVTEEEKEK